MCHYVFHHLHIHMQKWTKHLIKKKKEKDETVVNLIQNV